MARRQPRVCRYCGARQHEDGVYISWRGLCQPCALDRVEANNLQIAAGVGSFHEKRLRRMILRAHRDLHEARDGSG